MVNWVFAASQEGVRFEVRAGLARDLLGLRARSDSFSSR